MIVIPSYHIRGINILAAKDKNQFVDYLLNNGQVRCGTLIAINAEKVITIEQDKALQQLIQSADYKYADGISIVKSIKKKYPDAQLSRIAGADLWQALMQQAGKEMIPVFLVGGTKAVLAQTEQKLQQWQVNVVGSADGYFTTEERIALFERIRQSGARIVTVALGSPKQELFMRDCRAMYKKALYMGVGGTYDVFTGHIKRAPKMWQELGLEWLYRLFKQPTRWRRQVKLLKYAYYYCTSKL